MPIFSIDMTLLHADDLLDSSAVGRPTPGRMYVGPSGSGKTATLCRIADDAVRRDWIVVAAAPDRGRPLSEAILVAASALVMELNDLRPGASGVRGLSFTVERLADRPAIGFDDLARCMEAIGAAAVDVQKHVLLVIDDVHHAVGGTEEALGAVIEASRNARPVAVVAGMLGGAVPDGWDLIPVGPLKRADVLSMGGEAVVPVIDRVMELTGGWASLARALTDDIRRSRVEMSRAALDAIWPQTLQRLIGQHIEGLTTQQRRYLLAIADLGDGPVPIATVSKAMGDTGRFGESSALTEVRDRLVKRELVWHPSRDLVDIAMIGMRAYLRTFR